MKKIKYLGHYNSLCNRNEIRNDCLASTNKMNYIINSLANNGYDVEIISASDSKTHKALKGKEIQLADNVKLKLFASLGWGPTKIHKLFAFIFTKLNIFFYLLFNIKNNDQVIVYHSLKLIRIVTLLKKIKSFEMILEIEEIYNDVISNGDKERTREMNFLKLADKYIFPAELLNKTLNPTNKPYILVTGTYEIEPVYNDKFNDDKIHLLYAGTFDSKKGGITAAIETMQYLPQKYHLNIIGFGSEVEQNKVKKLVSEISAKTKASISLDGLFYGKDYNKFLQKCHIGLSTQNPNADFNETSFPSKILSYMANGLRVVSCKIKVVEQADIGMHVYYYENHTPKDIADAILKVDINDDYNSRELLSKCDQDFRKNLGLFINDQS